MISQQISQDTLDRFQFLFQSYSKAHGVFDINGSDPKTGKKKGRARTECKDTTPKDWARHLLRCRGLGAIPLLEEKERRRAQIDHAPLLSKRAKLIKIADKISNLEELERDPLSNWSISQHLAYAAWGEAVFDVLKGLSDGLDTRFRTTIKKVNTKLKPKKML